MADPLAELAERTVPEPTNFFDPREAQTILSRYANTRQSADVTRRALADVNTARESELRIMDDEDRIARNRAVQSREDAEYQARNEALLKRGDFLRTMARDLNPSDPGYNQKVAEFMAGLPTELAEDESIRGVLHSMNAEADDYRSQENARLSGERMLDRQQTMFREKNQLGLKHINQDDIKNAPRLADGSLDLQSLGIINNERERSYKEGEFNRKQDLSLRGKLKVIEARDLSKKGRERRANVDKFIVEDRTAFPPRFVNEVIQNYAKEKKNGDASKVNVVALESDAKWKGVYQAAQAKDRAPLANELSAAFAYEDPDTYVNLVPNLTDSQKERRRQVWEHAHRDGAVEESESPGAPAASAPETPPPAPSQRKTPTPDVIAGFREKAGGDLQKVKQMLIEAGY